MTEAVERSNARRTTLTIAAVLLLVGAWQMYRSRPAVATVLIGLAGLLTLVAVLLPPVAVWFHYAWMGLAAKMGYINSRILLTLVYYALLTPLGVWRRRAGYDPLTRHATGQSSYWLKRTPSRQPRQDFERGF